MARRPEPEPGRDGERTRLEPQPNGYAQYVDAPRASERNSVTGNPYPDPRRSESSPKPGSEVVGLVPPREPEGRERKRRRQRSIRSTVTLLLIIPLVTLIGLLAFAFTKTVPVALANRANTITNNDIGKPLQDMLAALNAEELQTYTLGNLQASLKSAQSMSRAEKARMAQSMSPSQLRQKQAQLQQAQQEAQALGQQILGLRAKTDTAVAAYEAGQAKLDKASVLAPRTRPQVAALLAKLKTITAIRGEADAGKVPPLTVLQGYTGVIDAIFPFIASSANPNASIAVFGQSMGTLYMGEALTDVATEAALGGGTLASGGTVGPPVYRLFTQTVDQQRALEQAGLDELGFEKNYRQDPYAAAMNSPQFKSFQMLEDQIIADGPGKPLPVSAQVWQQQSTSAIGLMRQGGNAERETVTANAQHESNIALYELFGISGLGLLLVLVSSLLLFRFGNRVSRELRGLRGAAQGLAFQRLPGVVSRLRAGEDLDTELEAPPLDLNTRTLEVTETADAFSAVQRTAVQAAIEQATLRNAVSNIFRRLARRNQGLLQRQLKLLDEMERETHDASTLGQLFRLDHLTTRMRRQAEGLIILSGAPPGRGWRQPVPVIEVLRGAVGEIEDYVRVDLQADPSDYLQGPSAADVTHLLAELIENAVSYSPPNTRVQVRGGRVANGYSVDIEDRGLGIPPDTMAALNQRLAEPPDFDVADSDQLGLFVVSRLAARHDIQVSLRTSTYGGVTAIVLLPHSLVVSPEEAARLSSGAGAGLPGQRRYGALAALGNGPGKHKAETSGPIMSAPVGPAIPAGPGAVTSADGIPRATGALNAGTFSVRGGGSGDVDGSGGAAAGPSGLPRREKLANMPAQFRPGHVPRTPSTPKSPEQARTLLSSIQRGLRDGRASADGSGPGGDGPRGRHSSDTRPRSDGRHDPEGGTR